jgi:tetratricopeptide (TPR) repeat protein
MRPTLSLPCTALRLLPLALLAACGLSEPPGKERFKSDPKDYAYRAQEYWHGGDYERAHDQWTKLVTDEPDHWKGRLGLAYCETEIGRQEVLRNAFERGRERLRKGEATFRELWGEQEISGSAQENLNAEREPWKAVMGLATNLRGQGRADEYEARLLEARLRSLAPNAPERPELAARVAMLRQRKAQNYRAALGHFERLLRLEDAPPFALRQAGELQLIVGDEAGGEARLRSWLSMAEGTRTDLREFRETSFDEVFRSRGAQEDAERLLKERMKANEAKQVVVLDLLAQYAFRQDRFDQALQDLERIHRMRSDDPVIWLRMAQCHEGLRNYDQAVHWLDLYVRDAARRDTGADENFSRAHLMLERCRKLLAQQGGR